MNRHHLIELPLEQRRKLNHYKQLIKRRAALRLRWGPSKEEIADLEERARSLLAEIDATQLLLNKEFGKTFANAEQLTNEEKEEIHNAYRSMLYETPNVSWGGRDFELRKFDRPFEEWKLYLERAILVVPRPAEIDWRVLDKREESLSPAQEHANRVASEVQGYLETIRLLEERCEDDVRNHPDQEREIRRRYRQSIEAIKDKA